MRRTLLLLTMVGAMLLAFSGVLLAQATAPSDQRQGAERYIVLLKDEADSKRVANQHTQQHAAQVKHVYSSAIRGYSAKLSAQALDAIRRDPNVLAVNEDLPQEAFCHKRNHACDTTPPTVSGVSPTGGTESVAANTDVTATFSEAMNSSTISTSTFYLKQGTTSITAAVTYDSTAKKATLNPNADLNADTTYTATVKGGSGGVKDVAGNALAQDKTWTFKTAAVAASPPQADTSPPETTVDSGPSGTVSSSTAKFTFSSSEDNSTFQCRLDGSPADWSGSACSSPKEYAGLSVGSHTFEVRATDAAGNTDSSPATRTWNVVAPQPVPTGVDRSEGDQSSAKAGDGSGTTENVAVAVIDGGIDYTHTDLNAARGINTVSPDGNQDCTTRDQNADSKDDNGHGTHVAGTVGAKDNGQDVVGVAPGVKQYAVKVLKDGSGYRSDVICGIDWVTANAGALGIKVANMSLGGGGSDNSLDAECKPTDGSNDAYHIAICKSVKAGVTYVVAAGNSNAGFGGTVPATYKEVLTVTATADTNGQPGGTWPSNACRTDEEDTAANFSNFTRDVDENDPNNSDADEHHTVAAPGACILSTAIGGGTTTKSGTSMASPHVVGTVALCIANGKCSSGLSPSQIVAKLREDAKTKTGSDPRVAGYYGFKDDPNSPMPHPNGIDNRYYGYLLHVGGY